MTVLTNINFENLIKKLGVKKDSIVYITGNLGMLGFPELLSGEKIKNKEKILEFYMRSILNVIGEKGTLVFPTHTFDLVKSDKVFDPTQTPTNYTLSEYLRNNLPARRQFHPFASLAAYGRYADEIISKNITRNPYGPYSPYEFLRNNNCKLLSLGLPARKTISAVHYCEFLVGVPYRYIKSFNQKVNINGEVKIEEFFLYVCYENIKIERDRNKKIFSSEKIKENLKRGKIGNSYLETLNLDKFINETIDIMLNDPYIWTRSIEKINDYSPWEK